ncbi:MAG: sporulation protein YqfD [Candidatus Limivicinus sp.]|jgi:similar to stage IV sporulation protein
MKKAEERIKGVCRVEICGAFPEQVLNGCALEALEIWDIHCIDSYRIKFKIYELDLEELEKIAEKNMCEMELTASSGGRKNRKFLKNHIWLAVSALLLLTLLLLSTLFIWDIDIYGCNELSEGEVRRALADCGVDYGSYWPSLTVDLVRNDMLIRLPELAWMSVNVSGSRAAVLISERDKKPEIYEESAGADLVAVREGIISNLSVLNGKPMVHEGQSVVRGDCLVSGRMESLSREPEAVRSLGEVRARTWYDVTAVSPAESRGKTPSGLPLKRYALKIAGKRINFYFGGRKTVDEYDKIVHNHILGIKNVFALPVTLVVETIMPYKAEGGVPADTESMAENLSGYLHKSVDGEIISCTVTEGKSGELASVNLRAGCIENIAEIREYLPAESDLP